MFGSSSSLCARRFTASTIPLAIAFALVLFVPSSAVADGAQPTQFHREDAFAEFTLSLEGCGSSFSRTTILVSGHDFLVRAPPSFFESETMVGVSVFEFCGPEVFLAASGTVTLEKFNITGHLGALTIAATVELCRQDATGCFPAELDIVLIGIGDITPGRSHVHIDRPNCKINLIVDIESRAAAGSGTLSYLGKTVTFTPADSSFPPMITSQKVHRVLKGELGACGLGPP